MKVYPPPDPGDIVWCRFPFADTYRPGPKKRPALVISVMDELSPLRVRVAYATSRGVFTLSNSEFNITLDDGEAYEKSGLNYPTKFDLKQLKTLPYTDEWFTLVAGARTPVVGQLHPALHARLLTAAKAARLIRI